MKVHARAPDRVSLAIMAVRFQLLARSHETIAVACCEQASVTPTIQEPATSQLWMTNAVLDRVQPITGTGMKLSTLGQVSNTLSSSEVHLDTQIAYMLSLEVDVVHLQAAVPPPLLREVRLALPE